MNFSQKTKSLVLFLLILNITLICIYWFVSRKITNNIGQISELATELDFQLDREGQLRSLRGITKDTEADRGTLDSHFVSPEGIVSLIKEVEGLASRSRLYIEIDSVGVEDYLIGENVDELIEILDVDLSTEGSWSSNFYFLSLLEQMPYRVSIVRLSFDAKKNTDGEVLTWEGIISLKILKLK
jgi:hypothetical protein